MTRKPIHPEELAGHSKVVESKVFLKYQQEVIDDEHIAQLVEKGRQEGLSWALAYKSQKWTGKEGRYSTYFATKTKILAKQFVQDSANWAKLERLIKSVSDSTFESSVKVENADGKEIDVSTYGIRFANGLEIVALSSNADAFRGWRGYKIADEFAIHKQQSEMLDSILPSRMWRFPFTLCSTHKGKNSEFNKLIVKFKKGVLGDDWNLITITIDRAVEEGLLEKIYKRPFTPEERKAWIANLEREEGIRRMNQEYRCIPEDEAGSFYSYDVIVSCEYDEALFFPDDGVRKFTGQGQEQGAIAWFIKVAFAVEMLGTGAFYIGMDIGRKVNYTVLALIEVVAGIRIVRAIAALDDFRYQAQQDCASIWIRTRRFHRLCVDNRGMGNETGERLQEQHGEYAVERIDATNKLKEIFAYACLRLMLDKLLRFPSDDTVRDDFHSIRKETTDSGNTRYVAGTNASDENSHGDFYTAISLGVHAAEGSIVSLDTLIEAAGSSPAGYPSLGDSLIDQLRQFHS
jgi:phage FluMu gp28-like protein